MTCALNRLSVPKVVMERRDTKARPHGFRSSLRIRLSETSDATYQVEEMTLAHPFGNMVSKAYDRTDFLVQCRALLERWAQHVTGGTGKIVSLTV